MDESASTDPPAVCVCTGEPVLEPLCALNHPCILCPEVCFLGPKGRKLGKTAKSTLIKASKRYDAEVHNDVLKENRDIYVHNDCYRDYTNPR